MPNAVWTGSLSLGLVVVPVRLYPAIHKKTVRFHEIDPEGRRVRHVRITEPEVEFGPSAGNPRHPVDRGAGSEPEPSFPGEAHERRAPLAEQSVRDEVTFDEVRKGFEVAP